MNSTIKNPEDLYRISRWAYSIGEPIMEDVEYGILQKVVRGKDIALREDSYATESCPTELLTKYGMTNLIKTVVLSGEKSKSIQSIASEEEARSYYANKGNRQFLLSYKMDGFNAQNHYVSKLYVQTNSRGRNTDVVDYNALSIHMPKSIDVGGHVRVYGEASLTKENFEVLKRRFPSKNYSSQRSSVSGAIASAPDLITYIAFNYDDPDGYDDILEKYHTLERWGFRVPPYVVCRGDEVIDKIAEMSLVRDYNLKSDGVVVTGLNTALVTDVRAIRIFSWKQRTYVGEIIGYSESYGRHYIGIKLRIKPVQTEDGLQEYIDIDNVARICKYGLVPGQHVVFEKVSAAVEHINLPMTALMNKGEMLYD